MIHSNVKSEMKISRYFIENVYGMDHVIGELSQRRKGFRGILIDEVCEK